MKHFENEQAKNRDTECKDREPDCTTGFLNLCPTFDQIDVNPDIPTQSIFPGAFKAHHEDQISFWVHNGEEFPTRGIAEPFKKSRISKSSVRIAQSVRGPLHRQGFRYRNVLANAYATLKDNAVSNHMFSWAISCYENRLIRFTLKERLHALPSPQKVNHWNHGKTKSRCLFCGLLGASTRHMQCVCGLRGANTLVTKRPDRVGCLVGDAARTGHKRPQMKINENKSVHSVC
jgi:hypothetical protein